MGKVSMSHFFSFSRYQTKCVIKFLFRQLMTSQTLRIIFNHPPKQWLTGRKGGKEGNTKMWLSPEQQEFFRWNKKAFFIVSEGLSKLQTQALRSPKAW